MLTPEHMVLALSNDGEKESPDKIMKEPSGEEEEKLKVTFAEKKTSLLNNSKYLTLISKKSDQHTTKIHSML